MFTRQEVDFLLDLYEQNTSSVVCPSEFQEDVDKFEEIYRLLKAYNKKGVLNLRYVLNNFIILENTFGSVSIGFLIRKCPQEHKPLLYAVLEYAGRLPIHLKDSIDRDVMEEIRKL